jgi:hypothetical protein
MSRIAKKSPRYGEKENPRYYSEAIFFGAGNRNRTDMGYPIRPSNVRVYHFRHSRGVLHYSEGKVISQLETIGLLFLLLN